MQQIDTEDLGRPRYEGPGTAALRALGRGAAAGLIGGGILTLVLARIGFLWWILGPLTLMPVFLGGTPQWTAAEAALAFPALIGHLGYGAGLGLTFYLLEARDRPWWLSRSESEAERIAMRKEQILTSAPAVWVLVVMMALTLPVLLGS